MEANGGPWESPSKLQSSQGPRLRPLNQEGVAAPVGRGQRSDLPPAVASGNLSLEAASGPERRRAGWAQRPSPQTLEGCWSPRRCLLTLPW